MSLDDQRIGFIGAGAMAEALVGGLRAAGIPGANLWTADPDPSRCQRLADRHQVNTTDDNAQVVTHSDVMVIAVKPAVVTGALAALASNPDVDVTRPLWISIAAGVPLSRLESALASQARIVRAMPNTPALVQAGATALCGNAFATPADLAAARSLFNGVGICWEAPAEDLLDAVTGLSGSGPAYVFVFLEALGDAGVRMGLPRDAAFELAIQTVYGAAKLALETGRSPSELKDQVTSPGGTTLAGLERLEAGGLRAAVHEAVAAATRRSRELGRD